ncbi:hypothetical protein GWK47_050357 [Chionoecetes opilio]|uniref:Uncharacterized protein n=1 Tax=Chionoecetes opilio TaxID=41210 RepID=A0A8J4Y8G0_CHIOP|nr:hypothetical protein GWK47_050357 [Chionoecetes opilio]
MILQQQQPIYQTHQEVQQARQHITPPHSQVQPLPQTVATSGGVIMASQGAPMSPRSQRAGAYVHVQGQVAAGAAPQQIVAAAQTTQGSQSASKNGQRSQNSQGYTPGDTTSRAPTPIQGPITSSPHRGIQPSTEAFTHHHLRTDPGMLYGSQRSLQSVGLLPEGRGAAPPQQPPRPISTSPPPYSDHQHSLTDSDIYGRIGMTRHVQVGGTLPAGFGRHQRGYNSLPPSRRQSYVPQTVEEQQLFLQQQQQHQQLSRRSSVASYTPGVDGRDGQRPAASNPSTPEKVLDKKEKSSKKEKDKKKKDAKTEKSCKKKWFWTLPLRRKKKNKDESTEDDDGGFKAASEKGARKPDKPKDDSSFIRYPSPDTASSDMNSSYSSEMSGEHSYRSSPSSEVYYYSQRAQQQTMHLHHQQQQQQQQQQQKLQQQQGGGLGPRSLPTTPVSPPDNSQASFVSVNAASQGVMSDVTDLTVTDLSRGRRYMSREELYAAMRHPQYYNYHRGAVTTATNDYSGQKSTPTPGRSASPAVFGVSPLPSYTVRPQAQNLYGAWPPDQQQIAGQPTTHQMPSESHSEDSSPTTDVEPPEAYQDLSTSEGLSLLESQGRLSPRKPPCGQESPNQQNQGNSTPKQTTRGDFKKMILNRNKIMSSAGGNHRISAVEMLRASRPGIYGYSPPPAPVVKPPQQPSPAQSRGEGVIMPPSSRNTARALLFQSRFGSGRRFRTPKTEIISTTILEDHGGEVTEQEDEEDSEEEEYSSSDSAEDSSHQNVRGPLARAYSEPCASSNTKSKSPSSSPIAEVAHSTPNTTLEHLPQPPDVSSITLDPVAELLLSEKEKENDEKESMETAL